MSYKNYKTLKQIWIENGRSSENIKVKSFSNRTPYYKLLSVNQSKNLAVLENYGKRKFLIGPRRKYIQTFTLDNPRWEVLDG